MLATGTLHASGTALPSCRALLRYATNCEGGKVQVMNYSRRFSEPLMLADTPPSLRRALEGMSPRTTKPCTHSRKGPSCLLETAAALSDSHPRHNVTTLVEEGSFIPRTQLCREFAILHIRESSSAGPARLHDPETGTGNCARGRRRGCKEALFTLATSRSSIQVARGSST